MPEPHPPTPQTGDVTRPTRRSARRVLIVDDSVTLRAALKLLVNGEPGWEVVGTAADGKQAIEQVRVLAPDIVVMDHEMPVMNGLEAVRELRTFSQVPVIIFSEHTRRASQAVLDLFDAGVSDVMAKAPRGPAHSLQSLHRPLMERLRALTSGARSPQGPPTPNVCDPYAREARLVVVGASTGGPPALEAFLSALQPSMTAPVVIAQHMPEMFTAALAQRLDRHGPRPTHLAADGERLLDRHVYVAPGGTHTKIRRSVNQDLHLHVGPDPADALHRPSVDALFESASKIVGSDLIAAVLTGMGTDGLRGARAVVAAGGKVVAQDAESCVVYGMPRAVVEAELAAAALPPAELARCISQIALRAA